MKKFIKILLFLLFIAGILAPQETQAAMTQKKANKLYAKAMKSGVIRKNMYKAIYLDTTDPYNDLNQYSWFNANKLENNNLQYLLYDFDGDNIKELVLNEGETICHIWTVRNGKVVLYLEYSCDVEMVHYYEKSKKIFWATWDGGGTGVIKYKKSGKVLKEVKRYETMSYPGVSVEDAKKNDKIFQHVRKNCKPLFNPMKRGIKGTKIYNILLSSPRNKKDIKALQKLISKYPNSKISHNMYNEQYIWSENGRLKKIKWSYMELKGKISFNDFNTLTEINCSGNQLTSISVNRLSSLKKLDCSDNSLTNLDVRSNTKLSGLRCDRNKIKEIDLSKNSELYVLNCRSNKVESLNLSKNKKLYWLDCSDNKLETLELKNNSKLYTIYCYINKLKVLNISKNVKLHYLRCDSNDIETLNLGANRNLQWLDCSRNNLKELDLSNNIELVFLDCSFNSINELDLKKHTNIMGLMCDGNQLALLDISNNPELFMLSCRNNLLGQLDINNNIELEILDCSENQLKELNINNNTKLISLRCLDNMIEQLNLGQNIELRILLCDDDTLLIEENDSYITDDLFDEGMYQYQLNIIDNLDKYYTDEWYF